MKPGFDSRAAGTPEHAWTDWLSALPTVGLPLRGRLLIVAAHPDDETLGAGGLIASAATGGIEVTVIVASNGDASHPDSPTYSPAQLADLRRSEVTLAISRLHPRVDVHFLDLPDSRLSDHLDELAERISRHMDNVELLVTPWSGDRHPDHAACANASANVARATGIDHWQFPIWAWHWSTPPAPELPSSRLRRLDLDGQAIAAKAHALEAHVSQHSALSPAVGDEAILNASMLAHFRRASEVFIVANPAHATSAAYFDALYRREEDPWGLADRFYEGRKRDILLASLPRDRFRRAFEPGCATGLLTVELARRCDEVVAWDGAGAAVEQTTRRVNDRPDSTRVVVQCDRIPANWPDEQFDLIVLSEIGYYCSDLRRLRERIETSLSTDGVVVACHWRHPALDHPVTAEAVHAALDPGLHRLVAHHEADFLLDIWSRDGSSVAVAEGLVR